jgi:hypothetical protein
MIEEADEKKETTKHSKNKDSTIEKDEVDEEP